MKYILIEIMHISSPRALGDLKIAKVSKYYEYGAFTLFVSDASEKCSLSARSMLGFCVKSSARARSVLGVDAREYSVSI